MSLSSKITLTENTSAEVWDSVIENNDELLAKYIRRINQSEELAQRRTAAVQDASLLPVYHGSAKNGLGIQQLMDAVIGLFQSTKEQGAPPCAVEFLRWSIQIAARGLSICGYTAERCVCGIRWP